MARNRDWKTPIAKKKLFKGFSSLVFRSSDSSTDSTVLDDGDEFDSVPPPPSPSQEGSHCPKFFLAGESGTIFQASDDGRYNAVASTRSPIISLNRSSDASRVFAIAEPAVLFILLPKEGRDI
jgi:hypothetical protein